MSRRVSLPAADDLFRRTAQGGDKSHVRAVTPHDDGGTDQEETSSAGEDQSAARRPSGRVRHDEKMTVYVTSDELLDLEHARLSLRRAQGLAVDRGRLVREAVALVLADYEANGDDSVLVRRLTEE
jgi:hypothetical protein